MPQLEDIPKLVAKTAPAPSDLVPIFDVTEGGNSPIKKVTLSQLLNILSSGVYAGELDSISFAGGGAQNSTTIVFDNGDGGTVTIDINTSTSSGQNLEWPGASGIIPAVPAYVDLTAANAALDAGDFWWDSTLQKLRTATA